MHGTIRTTTKDQITPSREALAEAARLDREALVRTLGNSSDENLLGFLDEYGDALHRFLGRHAHAFGHAMDAAHGIVDEGSSKEDQVAAKMRKKTAMKALRRAAVRFARHEKTDPSPFLPYFRIKLANPVAIQRKWNEQAKMWEGIRTDAGKIGLSALHAALAVGRTIRLPLRVVDYGLTRLGFNKLARASAAAIVAGSFAAHQFAPIDAAPHAKVFIGDSLTDRDLHPACRTVGDIGKADPFTIGFALAMMPDKGSKNYEAKLLHWLSAMRAMKQGVSPAAIFAISKLETLNFTDVRADGSSASGPYQTITETKIEWLARFYARMPSYLEAKERLDATDAHYSGRENDVVLTTALESLADAYKSDKGKVLAAFRSNTVNHAFDTAFRLADTPIVSGDLMAAAAREAMPELLISNLHGKTWEKFLDAVSGYYKIHLLGPSGARALNALVAKSPNTKMDTNGLSGVDDGYFVRVAAGNKGIFPKGNAAITATEYEALIKKYVSLYAQPVWNSVAERAEQVQTGDAACIMDYARFRQMVPATTSRAEIAYRTYFSPQTRAAIEGFINDTVVEGQRMWDRMRNGSASQDDNLPRPDGLTIEQILKR